MMEVNRILFLTVCAQYIRKKRINIIFGCILTTSIILLFQTTSKVEYIQNHLQEKTKDDNFNKKEVMFKLEHCNCTRTIHAEESREHSGPDGHKRTKDILFNETTCSKDAFMRGSGQKVVGFSFYGDINTPKHKKKGYFQGIIGNLKLMPVYVPGYVMRLYYDLDDNDPITEELCRLACQNPILDICNARRLPGTPEKDASRIFPMIWRSFPTLDPQVDILLNRDLDSRFSAREASAVKEWRENSSLPLHSMRDHPGHGIGMVGALWGTDLTRDMLDSKGTQHKARVAWKWAWKHMLKDKKIHARRDRWGPDQSIIAKYVWRPWGKDYTFQHDAYHCNTFNNTVSWPTQRLMEPNNFAACIPTYNETLTEKCPVECRRKPEWEYC